jgi:hypothetical protein
MKLVQPAPSDLSFAAVGGFSKPTPTFSSFATS